MCLDVPVFDYPYHLGRTPQPEREEKRGTEKREERELTRQGPQGRKAKVVQQQKAKPAVYILDNPTQMGK